MILFEGDENSFKVKNHGRTDVCAAVSMLVLNTVNAIEALTDEPFKCDSNDEGGYIRFALTEPPAGKEARLLLDTMWLGINTVKEEYPAEIKIKKQYLPVKTDRR
jgi:uncharacterized protein YsxB (DUF464 family)